MQVLSTILGGELEEVTTGVTLRVLAVNSASCVEWLMDVADVVDEESESIRSGLLFIFHMGLEGLVNEAGLIVTALRKPVDYTRDYHSDVVIIKLELGIVIK